MLVTISVTTYNHKEFIAQAINSILMQRIEFPYEIIIGDDCSTDGTSAIVDDIQRAHPELVRVIRPARNLGDNGTPMFVETLKAARGKYIAMLDGDDYWLSEDKLAIQVAMMEADSSCTMTYHNAMRVFDDGAESVPYISLPHPSTLTTEKLLEHNWIPSCSPMIRADVVSSLPPWYHAAPFGDWPLYLLATEKGTVRYINEVFGAYRVHSAGAWSRLTEEAKATQQVRFFEILHFYFAERYADKLSEGLSFHRARLIASLAHGRALLNEDNTKRNVGSDASEDEVPILERRAYELLGKGLYEEAGSLFKELVQPTPGRRVGHKGLAWTAEAQWRWTDAIQHWDQCIELVGPDHEEAIVRKGHCFFEIGLIGEARELLQSVSHRFDALEGLARVAQSQDTFQIASEAWDQCGNRFPDYIEGYLGKARLLIARESYSEGEMLLRHLLDRWPDSTPAYLLWAQCAAALKNWPVAEERWRSLLERWGQNNDVRLGYARYVALHEDYAAFTHFLGQLPNEPSVQAECLAAYHLARDNYGAASEQARLVVESNPQSPLHGYRYAEILLRQGSAAGLTVALCTLEDLHKRCPQSILVRIRLAEALIASGFDGQAEHIIRAFPEEDTRSEIEVLRAWQKHHHGDEKAARQHYDAALERTYVPAIHAQIGQLTRVDSGNCVICSGDILLFAVMRNEEARLNWFLTNYRNLGINRFIIVDNASTDDTAEILLQQPDVILYHTADRYSAAAWGVRWINALIDRHGRSNWCVYVDADEALVFPDSEASGLRQLTQSLSRNGFEAMVAPLLDMYPASIARNGLDIGRLQSSYCYFDNDLYDQAHHICPYRECYGGVRRRLFEGYQLLTKVPLINASAGIRFLISTHRITPARIADVTGALLHYHLISILQPEYRPLLIEAIEHREFANNSLERLRSRQLLPKVLMADSLLGKDSVRFQSVKQLVELGIIMTAATTGSDRQ